VERRIRLDGKPFSFRGHGYLRPIYDDTAAHIVLSKAAQIGGTTWAILRSIYACLCGLNVVYYFPTRSDVLEFSKSRVGPLLSQNPFLAKTMKDTDTAGLKQIGSAHLYLRGMQSPVGMKSVPADMLVFDELDEATPDAKAMARERLAHSEYKRIIELSNPSLPGYGIDEVFQQSDQRHWTVRCEGCATWTALDREFPTALGQEVTIIREREDGSAYRACPQCGDELDLEVGEWVADFPDRSMHGYRISQLISGVVDAGEILREYRTTRFPERFYNLKIGIPWADTTNRVEVSDVLRCCGDEGMLDQIKSERCTMGVDTGKQLHVVISHFQPDSNGLRQVLFIGAVQDYGDLDRLMQRFHVSTCVIDALPEIHATRAFASRHPGKVWLNYFMESQRGSYNWRRDERMVQENRTEALDASRQLIRDRKIVLPRRLPIVEEFAEHLSADVKQLIEDRDTGALSYRYVKTGTNHFSLAFTYDCVAWSRDRFGAGGIRTGIVRLPFEQDPARWVF
jgi:hypothetical protein